jgi:hypothetical protein|tara:strand:+ start:3111 stop:3299 length:189 start_codon:yes stop_codon:yes gene_type:complete
MKRKAIEVCNNLKRTIDTMKDVDSVENQGIFKTPLRAKKSTLQSILARTMKSNKLTLKDLRV